VAYLSYMWQVINHNLSNSSMGYLKHITICLTVM